MSKAAICSLFVVTSSAGLALSGPNQEAEFRGRRPALPRSAADGASLLWADYDRDGDLDALAIAPAGEMHLLQNSGRGVFDDATQSSGLGGSPRALLGLWEDFDRDGDPDLYLAGTEGSSALWRNRGDGGFEDWTQPSGIEPAARVLAAEWIDFDADRWPDLHLASETRHRLYRNRGDGTFEASEIGLLVSATSALAAQSATAEDETGDRRAPGSSAVAPTDAAVRGGGIGPREVSVFGLEDLAAAGRRVAAPESGFEALTSGTTCLDSILDQQTGNCVQVSSTPTLGRLYPLGPELNVNSLGNVGVGTTSPMSAMHISGPNDTTLRVETMSGSPNLILDGPFGGAIRTTGSAKGLSLVSTGLGLVQVNGSALDPEGTGAGSTVIAGSLGGVAADVVMKTQGLIRMIIDQDGRVGMGTTSPQGLLHVEGVADPRILVNTTDGSPGGLLLQQSGILKGSLIADGQDTYLDSGAGSALHLRAEGTAGMVVRPGGKVGINQPSPLSDLHVRHLGDFAQIHMEGVTKDTLVLQAGDSTDEDCYVGTGGQHLIFKTSVAIDGSDLSSSGYERMRISGDRVGIGTPTPARPLHVHSTTSDVARFSSDASGGYLDVVNVAPTGMMLSTDGTGPMHVRTAAGTGPVQFTIDTSGNVGIGTTAPATKLDVAGETSTQCLTITGGCDIVEGFETADGTDEPGTVLSIDPARPGLLRASRAAYDKCVAGVVSGAGGVHPGLKLSQAGTFEGGIPVAMAGRVYVKCSAENGPIEPGDLLTTAGTGGHAMKAADPVRSNGAVLGKAMSALGEGTGLVLVLVDLQ